MKSDCSQTYVSDSMDWVLNFNVAWFLYVENLALRVETSPSIISTSYLLGQGKFYFRGFNELGVQVGRNVSQKWPHGKVNLCIDRVVWQVCGHTKKPTVSNSAFDYYFYQRMWPAKSIVVLQTSLRLFVCPWTHLKAGSLRTGMTLWGSPVSYIAQHLVPETLSCFLFFPMELPLGSHPGTKTPTGREAWVPPVGQESVLWF